ncbi:Fic family protein [Pelistega sp. MC2]|uniref:Fic family protein n=1 Tax=Pelistega sp. MC2 TaxID=1720297 RepID=UPI0008D8D93B|nr:ATP-binding protein [Pelistega sp. MC2]
MFGKFESITERFPGYFLDYREPSENRWDERIVPDGTWSGNLFDFYRLVYKRIVADIKVPFLLQGDQRMDETVVHEVLREALINTLVHANYAENTPVLIEKFSDSFRFRNPGILRITRDEFFAGGVHDCRNALLHQMFLLIGLGERAGSGVPKILKGCNLAHWDMPVLEEKLEPPQYTVLSLLNNNGFSNKVESVAPQLGPRWEQEGTKRGPRGDQEGTKRGLRGDQDGTKSGESWDPVDSPHIDDRGQTRYSVGDASVNSSIPSHLQELLQILDGDYSIQELMQIVNRSNRTKFRRQYLKPLIELGLIEMTIPDKPTSSKQRYRKVMR